MTFEISVAHNEARLQGSVAFADAGPANSTIEFYDTAKPAFGAAPLAPAIATLVLAKPCGTITGGVLSLTQADPAGAIAIASGTLVWGRWLNGNGLPVADGTVSDSGGSGDFKLSGTAGTAIYAGGSVLLGSTSLG